MESRVTLIEQNITFAKNLARRFYRRREFMGFEREDFESAAYIGLCEAACRFNSERGQNFRSYSYTRINGSMYDLLRRTGEMTKAVYDSIIRETDETRIFSDRTTGLKALAETLNAADELNISLHYVAESSEIELSYRGESDPQEVQSRVDLKRKLGSLLAQLPEPERTILEQHYLHDRRFSEISSMLDDMSKTKVCRLHHRALKQLREFLDGGTVCV